ncbi:MAG: FadR family transcriptional regulator, partial [Spirochaetaceae bacterium]|nr:FadR family transcriptional regulator [Spirochaetaceae bacterium]
MDSEELVDPTNTVIDNIRTLIADRTYKPGMRLPSERVLADSMHTTRGYIRKALQRLELYGVISIRPQSGIYIA